jgi:hypothetical protein
MRLVLSSGVAGIGVGGRVWIAAHWGWLDPVFRRASVEEDGRGRLGRRRHADLWPGHRWGVAGGPLSDRVRSTGSASFP